MAGMNDQRRSKDRETSLAAHTPGQDSMACPHASLRRPPFKAIQQSTERFATDNILQAGIMKRGGRWQSSVNWNIAEASARPLATVEMQPLVEDMPQAVFSKDDEVIQDFFACAAHPTFQSGFKFGLRREWA
jgi:hypothetical protein